MINNRKITLRLPVAVHAASLVDGRQVIKHLVGLRGELFQIREHGANLVGGCPERRDVVKRRLAEDRFNAKFLCQFVENCGFRNHAACTLTLRQEA